MTTLLTPAEVGKVTLITTATAFFALFLINPVGMFINRRLHAWVATGLLKRYFHLYCLYLIGVAAVAALLVWILLQSQFWDMALSPAWCAGLVAGSLLFNTINQTLVPSLNMLDRVRPFIILTIGTLAVGLVFSTVLVEWFGANAVAWLAGPIFSQIAFSLLAYTVFFRDGPTKSCSLNEVNYKRLFDFAWPISLAVGFNWLHLQGYRFMLADLFGIAELGLFAAGYGLAASLTSACESVTMTWFQPRFYQEANSGDAFVRGHAWGHYASIMIPFSLLASSGIFMTAPYLTSIMLGQSYQTAVSYVMTGALAEWGRTLFNIFALDAHSSMKTRQLIVPSIIGVVVAYATMIIPVHMEMIMDVPLALLAGSLAAAVAIRLCVSQRATFYEMVDWLMILRTAGYIAGVCVVFTLCRYSLLQFFGRFEPYVALLFALSLWGGISWILLRQRMLATK